jgi:tRNA(Ile)-lysidine synthase
MALVALLRDLQRLHHWDLQLWHGDHQWRPESGQQASELEAWAQNQGLVLSIDRWATPIHREAAARDWRYSCLIERARAFKASHVVTAHTASDRAETLLLHLARGSHRRGLASLQGQRELGEGLQVVRPLLIFSRQDTAQICQDLQLPIWLDPSNQDLQFSRNRVRAEVLPVLEALHPGASRRINALAERLAAEDAAKSELLQLALEPLRGQDNPHQLQRRRLMALSPANQRELLHAWLTASTGLDLGAQQLETLLARLAPAQGPGQSDLAGPWRLQWDRTKLHLKIQPNAELNP